MEGADWKQLIKKHYGRRYCKHTNELMWNICSVDAGVKVSYLIDCFIPQIDTTLAFIEDLRQNQLIHQYLIIIQLEDCVFISSQDNLKTGFHSLNDSQCKLLDISHDKKMPECMPDIRQRAILSSIQDVIVPQLIGYSDRVIRVEFSEDINRSTVYGLLLGYPVVYWYKDITSARNCLEMVQLNVVKVTIVKDGQERCLIYSFSYPCALQDSVHKTINMWLHSTESAAQKRNLQLVVSEDSEMMSTVVL